MDLHMYTTFQATKNRKASTSKRPTSANHHTQTTIAPPAPSIRHFKQLTLGKVRRDGLTDLVVERRSDDHATTDVAKVGVAPGRDALSERNNENVESMSGDERHQGKGNVETARTHHHVVTPSLFLNRRGAICTSARRESREGTSTLEHGKHHVLGQCFHPFSFIKWSSSDDPSHECFGPSGTIVCSHFLHHTWWQSL